MDDLRQIQILGPNQKPPGWLLVGLDGNGQLWQGLVTAGAKPTVEWTLVKERIVSDA